MNVIDELKQNSELAEAIDSLLWLNPLISGRRSSDGFSVLKKRDHRLQKVLVANRGEIAKRFFLALHEEGIPSVAVVTDVDRGQSWYEFADEVLFIGHKDNYAGITVIIAALLLSGANAIYSGYGFLSESPDFVEKLERVARDLDREIIFMGPDHATMRMVGDKINARALAAEKGVPLFMSSPPLGPDDQALALTEAARIGYPLMVKLTAGGGGKGMQLVQGDDELKVAMVAVTRIGRELYNNSTFYLEEYIGKPVHIEVQVFNGRAIGIRKCSVQRNNQKIIEESGHNFFDDQAALSLLDDAEKIAVASGYERGGGAGTVEFLIDAQSGKRGFLEVNTRLQVEYAVTDQSLGIDLAKWQILFYDGRISEIPGLGAFKEWMSRRDHSIECRIYAEEPENNYLPSPGVISVMDLPTFNGIRCDFGFGEGDSVLSMYDPMIGKIIAHGATRREAIIRMERALQELYIKGVKTTINQLLRIVRHGAFIRGDYTNNLLTEHQELSFFSEADGEGDVSDRRKMKQVIFGAFAEYGRLVQRSVREFLIIANMENIIDSPVVTDTPVRFIIGYRGRVHAVEFIQTAIDTFLTYVDGRYNGRILLISVNSRSDDFLVIFGKSSYRIRVNRYADFSDIRMRGDDNKIQYYRVSVKSDRAGSDGNIYAVRSPFQGTFVAFARDGLLPGSRIECNEPLVVLSSMKMETTLRSPCSGRIIEVIENGDLSKLRLMTTADGRIIGKSLQENELLFKIEADADTECAAPEFPAERARSPYPVRATGAYDEIMNDNDGGTPDPMTREYFDELLELFNAVQRGMIYQHVIIERVIRLFKKVIRAMDHASLAAPDIERINGMVRHYARIKRLFSPILAGEGLTFPQELTRYIQRNAAYEEDLSGAFRELLGSVLDAYGLGLWEGTAEMKRMFLQHCFVQFRRSYRFCLDHTDVIMDLVRLLAAAAGPSGEIIETFNALLEQEQSEKDDSLLKVVRKVLDEKVGPGARPAVAAASAGRAGIEFAPGRVADDAILARMKESLAAPAAAAQGLDGPGAVLMERLGRNRDAGRLYSPDPDILLLSASAGGVLSFGALVRAASLNDFDDVLVRAASLVSAYHALMPGSENWVDVIVAASGAMAFERRGCPLYLYDHLKNRAWAACAFFDSGSLGRVHLHFEDPGHSFGSGNPPLYIHKREGRLQLDLLHESDRANPYCLQEKSSIRDQRLFNIGKWPIELWASLCFDPGTMAEIVIDSIDGADVSSKSNSITGMRPVGAKIFHGTIKGADACFYMKDSRISGGSTGSREGLKYIAAVYLSYLKDWPLYVWNDSAGANIGEGVVSLNRGAEGFMMNALAVQMADGEKFRNYTKNIEDPEMRELFQELHSRFNLSFDVLNRNNRHFILAAVGIGSSAGLDVYGSSQATVQLLLDSEHSYRVLTGSSVIRTVIGEDISNYDIGGAKILGQWTGIVDLVAADKLHMIVMVRELHRLFSEDAHLARIGRNAGAPTEEQQGADDVIVLTESTVRGNVDDGMFWGFKKDYYASEALVGGFARLAGMRVLVMGPRTNFGLRSISSIIRARELLRMAVRTRTPQILVYGKKWQQSPDYHENISMRSRLDFIRTIHETSGLRIHVITHVEGLKLAEISGNADAVIFISRGGESPVDRSFIAQNSSFIVPSFEDAFDLSCALIKLVCKPSCADSGRPGDGEGRPSIPLSPAEPYDIVSAVIERAFDAGTFVEFYRDMNHPVRGPHLVTGLARLRGRTVGIIADQPLVKGGGADAFGTEKFRVFVEFLNGNAIPLVMLSNSSGFVPGSQQERYRIQAIGAESLNVNILGEIPVVSVALNQNYGGRLIHAFNKFLRPGIVYLALDRAIMAVIGADAAFELLFGKKYQRLCEAGRNDEAEKLRGDFMLGYLSKARADHDALGTGLVDWLIHDVADLRQHLIRGMNRAFQRCREAFGHEWHDL
jgi:acetyl/propionyl-CoA carboxylase alpha subunit/acetyl-CoA carboxylase carboxyltransferase component